MNKIKSLLNSSALPVGLALALIYQAFVLPDGGDCSRWFYKPYSPLALIPAWSYLLLWPATLLPMRLAWALFVILLVSGIIALGKLCHHPNWVIALCLASPITFSEVWLGQIGFFTVWGLVLVAVGFKKHNHWWSGLGVALLAVKPQVVWVLVLCLIIWTWRERQLVRLLLPGSVLAGLSLAVYGNWVAPWLRQVHQIYLSPIWPFCVLLLPLLLLPGQSRRSKAILALGLSLTCSPYVNTYHSLALAVLVPPLQIVGWGLALFLKFPYFDYAGFVIPLVYVVAWLYFYCRAEWPLVFGGWSFGGIQATVASLADRMPLGPRMPSESKPQPPRKPGG